MPFVDSWVDETPQKKNESWSDCVLGTLQLQSNSPFRYDSELDKAFSSLTSSSVPNAPKVMSLNTDAGRLVVAQRSTQSHRRLRIPSLASTVLQADQPIALVKQRSRQLFKAQLWPATEMIRPRVATLAIKSVSSKKSRYFLSFMRTVFRDTVPTFPPKGSEICLSHTFDTYTVKANDTCYGLMPGLKECVQYLTIDFMEFKHQ